jgi:hypothetical protein
MSLISWKKKRDKYDDDEMDGDFTEAGDPRLTDTIQDPEFIMRDETNAEAMRKMRMKW